MPIPILRPKIPVLSGRSVPAQPKPSVPYYHTAEHIAWAKQVLRNAGYRCQGCGSLGRLYADHIIELRDGGPPLDLSNGMALCASCHTSKTIAVRAQRLGLTR